MTDDIMKEEATVEEPLPETEDILTEAEEINRGGKDQKKKVRKLEAQVAESEKKLAEKEGELTELNDKYLRLAAEYDNFRRRTAQERDRIYDDAYAAALAAIFPVIDNLERAAQYADGENVTKGVAMTLKSAAETLEKLGITEIEAMGKTFDPQYHNAVLHVEDAAYGESEIVEVLQKGYMKGDRILRYAMVKVAN
ncbi:MAG: nucleotide exchange factor GrpE [Clostridia bacterium]|nr:nucleotide exchange factor GrpE [Clostridia bacterium]